ncbi:hypothetical protein KLPPOU148_033 [Klebsiella phage vB_KpnM_15-38_KLPPOU148]|uniref:Uncharacterized protein n=1 Tax=Klebsiella phage vB_KpnM_15-38_KLPPOU148 TaxID=2686208 RepID=A0A6B9J2E3_9CAUD|nr:hypothetical protein PQZ55_gp33 [Klebsiella phage vB_KpnM_15-38_KLPPOU148]QGZ13435.1 hypothetical protein KLPPOU148_033 [Klebsiella phage vB_KpnM_15-38_KLPPOU148]
MMIVMCTFCADTRRKMSSFAITIFSVVNHMYTFYYVNEAYIVILHT